MTPFPFLKEINAHKHEIKDVKKLKILFKKSTYKHLKAVWTKTETDKNICKNTELHLHAVFIKFFYPT